MTEVSSIDAVAARTTLIVEPALVQGPQEPALSFADLLARGVEDVEQKLDAANNLVGQFAVDDSIPVHQVTIALEEARLAVELMVQVRTRLVEGYREIMNMQL